jgi:hypothetical protein
MFCPVKGALKARKFSADEDVIGVMQNWLKTQ